ncbi:PRD domain-containing protein [Bacillus haynesii]|uniref:PRD domain-containing protein n=1 Tax=Bacillus TaxID=1386 RepID=UPI00228170ED|nr:MULTISPECIES: PRD domain-containing protein [Bacillus]MCY7817746.1 PRD domain-containing protein [Bacillus haynesii]MCY8024728.1 PRD domain-containing protein [Bacillus sonorensis]MCY8243241.1 PRD domain-containing protein [Bacillus haynesii]MCY8372367.1 PRD domain-containing protein [Bacillus haynesii]MCY8403919.1 PRD domain-containing protein [Bacillus sonorensis]
MFKIKKVLNSSVVLAEDQNRQEMVLCGRGIGYGQKPGNMIEEKQADQVFMPVDNMKAKEFLQLLDSMPQEFIELTQQIVQHAEERLKTKLNSGVYFTLMDHLNFAVERYKKNINITNRVYWEIKNYYTEEFEAGNYALQLINETFGIQLPKEEAANIAFHLINALGEETESKDGMKYAKMIGSIVNLVRYTLNMKLDQENIHYSRFITHVKFFVERFYADKLLANQENELFEQIANLYPQAMDVAFKIKDYIKQVHGNVIPNDELTYLAVHIHRLISYQQLK